MNRYSYSNLSSIKSRLSITSTSYDSVLLALAEASASMIDGNCNRTFNITTGKKYYSPISSGFVLIDDLLSVTTVKMDEDNDGIFETEYTSDEYNLLPLNGYPKQCIEIIDYPLTTGTKKIEIDGVWGYGNGTSNPYKELVGIHATVNNSSTSITLSSASSDLSAGMTIKVDTEFMFVTGNASTTLTVERATNGSTIASHTTSDIYIVQYPLELSLVGDIVTSRLYTSSGSESIESESLGDRSIRYNLSNISTNSGMLPMEEVILNRFKKGFFV